MTVDVSPPVVSVIVNVYNGALTLSATLESILAQSYSNFELIIWDDCSQDESLDIARSLNDSRIRIFTSDSNLGLGAARRGALGKARGQWIGFVDQDDLWVATTLADFMRLAGEMPEAGFVYGRTLRFFNDGSMEDYDHRHEYKPLPRGDIFTALFVDSCFIAISAALFRRSVIAEVPEIPDWINSCPDYYLYLQIARILPVNATDNVVCLYRMHDHNMTHSYGARMQREILRLLDSWSDSVPPQLLNRRRRVHSTVLAFVLLRQGNFLTGLKVLLREGSLSYLLARPFVRQFRKIRRRLNTPVVSKLEDPNAQQLLEQATIVRG